MTARRSRRWATAVLGAGSMWLVWLGALAALPACHLGQGAVAIHPTSEGRDAIARVASGDFGGARAILDEDAVTGDGTRVVAASQLAGAAAGRVERFHLVRHGERCLLVHDRTDRAYELASGACEAP